MSIRAVCDEPQINKNDEHTNAAIGPHARRMSHNNSPNAMSDGNTNGQIE
jgi:hypothetical protein